VSPVKIQHFSDLLCVWAYVAQRRIDELVVSFGDAIELDYHHFSVFGSVRRKFERSWAQRGGAAGYRAHLAKVEAQFDHLQLHPKLWIERAPESSLSCHLFLAAIREAAPEQAPAAAWRLREAFFCEARDISSRAEQLAVAEELGLDLAAIEAQLHSGRAHARMNEDLELAQGLDVRVSPTLVFNEGRQRLIGNVGYRVIEANVRELLHVHEDAEHEASWC